MANFDDKNCEKFYLPKDWTDFRKKYEKEINDALEETLSNLADLIIKHAPIAVFEALMIKIKQSLSDEKNNIVKFYIPHDLNINILRSYAANINVLFESLIPLFKEQNGQLFAESFMGSKIKEAMEKGEFENKFTSNSKNRKLH